MTSSTGAIPEKNLYPLLTPEKKTPDGPSDYVKITAIVVAVIGALLTAVGFLCIQGMLPPALLGGTLGVGITLIIGLAFLLPSAYVIWKRW